MRKYKESWSITHTPAANNQATKTRAADSAGYHKAMSFSYSVANASASQGTVVHFQIRDGASGAGTILWQEAVAIDMNHTTSETHRFVNGLRGTKNTAMTVEFDGAGGADIHQSVNLEGETHADPGAD